MIGFYGNKRLANYEANYIKEEATSNIQLEENWQEAARCEYIKIKHLEFNHLHKTMVPCKLRPKQQVKGTVGPNKILMTSIVNNFVFISTSFWNFLLKKKKKKTSSELAQLKQNYWNLLIYNSKSQ